VFFKNLELLLLYIAIIYLFIILFKVINNNKIFKIFSLRSTSFTRMRERKTILKTYLFGELDLLDQIRFQIFF